MNEAAIQRSIVSWLEAVLPQPSLVVHVANNPRSRVAGAMQKAMGAKKGFPDVLVFHPIRTVAIEVKKEGQYARPEQREMMAQLNACGVHTAVCRSIDDARETLRRAGIQIKEA
jgi:hypothetical protein